MTSRSHEKFVAEIVGQTLNGRYSVERVLGEGGMGVVVAGRHPELDQAVAIKFMWPEFAADEALAKRFLHEGKVAAKVHSPHLVRVFDVGRIESGVPYLVMEMLKGRDLDTELAARGPLPIADALDWFLQALVGLAEIHAAGIVHRDLKPANLFLCETPSGPVVKLLDFGISKDMKATGEGLTATDTMLGTPQYMSPEQVKSSKHVDLRSDIWTLGVILYELFTGKLPFRGSSDSDGFGEVFGLILFKEPPPPSELRPGLPLELEATILRCLRKNPAERFQSVSALANALRPLAHPSSSHRIESVRRTIPDVDEDLLPRSKGSELALGISPPPATARTVAAGAVAARERAPQTAAPLTRPVPIDPARSAAKTWTLGAIAAAATVVGIIVARAVFAGHDAPPVEPSAASSSASPAPVTPSSVVTATTNHETVTPLEALPATSASALAIASAIVWLFVPASVTREAPAIPPRPPDRGSEPALAADLDTTAAADPLSLGLHREPGACAVIFPDAVDAHLSGDVIALAVLDAYDVKTRRTPVARSGAEATFTVASCVGPRARARAREGLGEGGVSVATSLVEGEPDLVEDAGLGDTVVARVVVGDAPGASARAKGFVALASLRGRRVAIDALSEWEGTRGALEPMTIAKIGGDVALLEPDEEPDVEDDAPRVERTRVWLLRGRALVYAGDVRTALEDERAPLAGAGARRSMIAERIPDARGLVTRETWTFQPVDDAGVESGPAIEKTVDRVYVLEGAKLRALSLADPTP
jgi:serine/threonine-protein kinase